MIEHETTVEFTEEEVEAAFRGAEKILNMFIERVRLIDGPPTAQKMTMEIMILGTCYTLKAIGDNTKLPLYKALMYAAEALNEMPAEGFADLGSWEFRPVVPEVGFKLQQIKIAYDAGHITLAEAIEQLQVVDPKLASTVAGKGGLDYAVPLSAIHGGRDPSVKPN
ncbi:hypothetical protein UFOVP28_6 [uncultured Caudovirales phage]|uniref:Uncharacterized protein n=1 Tax=uncultured Caudovirales phage TaxID=2100421 RepID=A0A6J5KMC7_9CAUD|nr:hypothetical protein UFOVP28_6 [uncultured Caudovirales phage]